MKHLRALTYTRPAKAQFESISLLVGLIDSLFAFYLRISCVFGIPVPSKSGDPQDACDVE